MLTQAELEDMLKNESLLERIVRSLGSSTVALFGIYYVKGQERLKLAGTGTLAMAANQHGILTAAHVWEELQSLDIVGITRTEKIDHRYPIDVKAIVPTVWKAAGKWNEHGPDLAFLRIPAELVGEIEASQVFEDLERPAKLLGVDGAFECWVPMGIPAELGAFTDTHASVEINGSLVDPRYLTGDPDYYEFEVDTTGPGIPNSYGGFSGGGLWRVVVYSSPSTGKVEWAQRLKGVMFWQSDEVNGRRVIHCHGPESIAAMIKMVGPRIKSVINR